MDNYMSRRPLKGRRREKEGRKRFFFEKKKQKTFIYYDVCPESGNTKQHARSPQPFQIPVSSVATS
jgi:hypothetical protein